MDTALEPGRLRRAVGRIRNLVRPNVTVTPPPTDVVRAEYDVAVAVRDGAVLRVNVYRPVAEGAYPVIMSAHPYGKDYRPKATGNGYRPFPNLRILPQSQPFSFSAWTGWEAPDPAFRLLPGRGHARWGPRERHDDRVDQGDRPHPIRQQCGPA